MPKRIHFTSARLTQLVATNNITPERFVMAMATENETGYDAAHGGWWGNLFLTWEGPSGGVCSAYPLVVTGAPSREAAMREVTIAANATRDALTIPAWSQPELF